MKRCESLFTRFGILFFCVGFFSVHAQALNSRIRNETSFSQSVQSLSVPHGKKIAFQKDEPMPMSWFDAVYENVYYLTEPLVLNSNLKLSLDDKFFVQEIGGGGGYVPVTYFQLKANHCENEKATQEMIMIRPKLTPEGANGQVAVEWAEGCIFKIWVENREIDLPSFFTASSQIL